MGLKKLIINADDFGQSKGINRGIIQCHEKGVVTSASLMVNYPAAIEAAEYAKSNSKLGVGIHLDFGEWVFKNEKWEMSYSVVNLDNSEAVRREIHTQLNKFVKITGRNPSHIDSHQHIHLNPAILPIVDEFAAQLNLPLRRHNDIVFYCGSFYGQSDNGDPHHEIISPKGFLAIIDELPDVQIIEMSCHPALDNDVEGMYKLERKIEAMTLCNMELKTYINDRGYQLCSFNGLSSKR